MPTTTTRRVVGVTLVLLALVIGRAGWDSKAAHAAGLPGRTYTTVTRQDMQTSVWTRDKLENAVPWTPCCLHYRTVKVTTTRHGIFGGLLWTYYLQVTWGYRAGWVWTHQFSQGGSGSLTWSFDGLQQYHTWGRNGLTYVGMKSAGTMTSKITEFYTEVNHPWVSITANGDGSYTSQHGCGC